MSNPRLDVVYKPEWQFQWKDHLRPHFPEDFSAPDPQGILKIGFALKHMGVNWHTQQELGEVLHRLHRIQWIEIEMNAEKSQMRFRWKPITWV